MTASQPVSAPSTARAVGHVACDQLDLTEVDPCGASTVVRLAGAAHQQADLVAGAQQGRHAMGADKACSARQQHLHGAIRAWVGCVTGVCGPSEGGAMPAGQPSVSGSSRLRTSARSRRRRVDARAWRTTAAARRRGSMALSPMTA